MLSGSKRKTSKIRFQRGATTVEYAMLCAGLALAIVGVVWSLGGAVTQNLNQVSASKLMIERDPSQERLDKMSDSSSNFQLASHRTEIVDDLDVPYESDRPVVWFCFVSCLVFSFACYLVKVYW